MDKPALGCPPGGTRAFAELEAARAGRWAERDTPRPAYLPETFEKLAQFLGTQAGMWVR